MIGKPLRNHTELPAHGMHDMGTERLLRRNSSCSLCAPRILKQLPNPTAMAVHFKILHTVHQSQAQNRHHSGLSNTHVHAQAYSGRFSRPNALQPPDLCETDHWQELELATGSLSSSRLQVRAHRAYAQCEAARHRLACREHGLIKVYILLRPQVYAHILQVHKLIETP